MIKSLWRLRWYLQTTAEPPQDTGPAMDRNIWTLYILSSVVIPICDKLYTQLSLGHIAKP